MQCQYVTSGPDDFSDSKLIETKIAHFQAHFEGCMEMYSDAQTVAEYLNQHDGWFCRCAEPMKTEPMGNNGYLLAVGKYGAFGHDVEPKMAVVLEPPVDGVYYMHSIPLESEEDLGYQVDYRALMTLDEVKAIKAMSSLESAFRKQGMTQLPDVVTKVTWELHMDVMVRFPKFISKLPWNLVQTTGDRLLSEIVRQISPRLTYKVQQDFHHRLGLPLPNKAGRTFQKIDLKTVAA
ncbi:transposase [Aphanothece hegewaldii CCALA 016]|uniref:Transposase n=1 Tax=Aphanothece hegewaldii CCALA 016 TaxID=2107694 RepID=A0A2T1M068_9CHRO|nr:DUF1997 domain-containing protein [Aphanothece hegewaldii]PSF38040.1 transposase [Aphanothece hegewaldii CCALA 016]